MYTYPRPLDLPYPARVLSNEGALSRGDPSADRAKAGRTGAPRNGRWPGGRWSAGRRCALPWARARLPCRARWVHRLPQGCPLVPWRLPPLHPLARFARDWQTSDALRRENVEAWLFESTKAELSKDAATYSASYAGLTRVSITLRKSLTKRMDCRVKPGNDENLVSRARCGILHAASQNRDRTGRRRSLRPRLCSAPP